MKNLLITLALLFSTSVFAAIGPAYTPAIITLDNEVIVKALGDFPLPQSGVITLNANVGYTINGVVNIGGNRIVGTTSNVIRGMNPFGDVLVSSSSGNCISGVDAHLFIEFISISCVNGVAFDYSDVAATKTHVFIANKILIVAAVKMGNFTNMFRVAFFQSGGFSHTTGFTFNGSDNGEFASHFMASGLVSGVMHDFGTAVFDEINITNSPYTATESNTWISGTANGANMTSGHTGRVTHNSIVGSLPPTLVNISHDDEEWNFIDNTSLADSLPEVHDGFIGNVTATVVTEGDGDAGNPKLVAGTWIVRNSSQFTCTAAGRCTYNGLHPVDKSIIVSVKFSVASGANKDICFFTAFNGTVRSASEIGNKVDAMDFKSVTVLDVITFDTGDYVEIWTENQTSLDDIEVDNIHRIIN